LLDRPPPPGDDTKSGDSCAEESQTVPASRNKAFDIDEMNSRLVEPAVALTAIGADIETGRATP